VWFINLIICIIIRLVEGHCPDLQHRSCSFFFSLYILPPSVARTGLLWFLSHACTCSFPISTTSARFSAGAASPATSHRLRYAALCVVVACIAVYYWGFLSVGQGNQLCLLWCGWPLGHTVHWRHRWVEHHRVLSSVIYRNLLAKQWQQMVGISARFFFLSTTAQSAHVTHESQEEKTEKGMEL